MLSKLVYEQLEKNLHDLIEYTAWYQNIELPDDLPLPDLSKPLPDKTAFTQEPIPEEERRGFYMIPGMYGGVNYRYEGESLICVSFCRICEGSEIKYRVTTEGVELIAHGSYFREADNETQEWFKGRFREYLESNVQS